jgi:hypothetical protein
VGTIITQGTFPGPTQETPQATGRPCALSGNKDTQEGQQNINAYNYMSLVCRNELTIYLSYLTYKHVRTTSPRNDVGEAISEPYKQSQFFPSTLKDASYIFTSMHLLAFGHCL